MDLEVQGYKCEATLFPPRALCPAVLSLSFDFLSRSSSAWQSAVLSSLSLSETNKGSTLMKFPASNIDKVMKLRKNKTLKRQ